MLSTPFARAVFFALVLLGIGLALASCENVDQQASSLSDLPTKDTQGAPHD